MAEKGYYYLKLKENFFDTDEMKILESMENGYLYSNILLKLYLKALKNEGKLTFNEYIPYDIKMLATITGHNVDIVEKAIKIFQSMHLIEVLDNGIIYMLDIQNFIGSISSEGIRKAEYREKVKKEKENKGTLLGQSPDIISNSISNSKSISKSEEEKKDRHNYKEIIDIYHQLCPSFPKCKTLSDKRKKQIKARLDTYSIEQIKEVFTNAENSDFLKGKVNGFKADFDWLMNDNNFAKTLEGKYNHSLTSPKSINNQQTKYNITKSGTIDLSPKFID